MVEPFRCRAWKSPEDAE